MTFTAEQIDQSEGREASETDLVATSLTNAVEQIVDTLQRTAPPGELGQAANESVPRRSDSDAA